MYRIHGMVQGVGFRAFVYHWAHSLGIKGFVQNEIDGSVTVVAQGNEESLEELEVYLKSGPSFSRVEEVEKIEIPIDNYDDFEIR
jgi:acylphosphatase